MILHECDSTCVMRVDGSQMVEVSCKISWKVMGVARAREETLAGMELMGRGGGPLPLLKGSRHGGNSEIMLTIQGKYAHMASQVTPGDQSKRVTLLWLALFPSVCLQHDSSLFRVLLCLRCLVLFADAPHRAAVPHCNFAVSPQRQRTHLEQSTPPFFFGNFVVLPSPERLENQGHAFFFFCVGSRLMSYQPWKTPVL